jgi:hypothetical protein
MNFAVVAIYSSIEAYPPALNALQCLSSKFDKIEVVQRNVMPSDWKFPQNIEIINSGRYHHYSIISAKPFWWKMLNFLQFAFVLRSAVVRHRPAWVILHDPLPILAWSLIRHTIGQNDTPKIWYHNHDVILGNESVLMRWAYRAQKSVLPSVDKFSLPTELRLPYFKLEGSKVKPMIIPNYPSKSFFGNWVVSRPIDTPTRLIFQGHISPDSGLELFLKVLPFRIAGRQLELNLVGPIDPEYKLRLLQLADQLQVTNQLVLRGRVPYRELPAITSQCHIGLATYGKQNLMVKTMGTASNKIYEYVSVGLPVIVYDDVQFIELVKKYPWAIFIDGTMDNLNQQILYIIDNYERLSKSARLSFEESLNFEDHFENAIIDL